MQSNKSKLYNLRLIMIIFSFLFCCTGCNLIKHPEYQSFTNVECVPDFNLKADEHYYSRLKTDENILLFWSSSCPHCENVISYIMQDENSILRNSLFTVSIDSDIEDVRENSKKFPIYLDYKFEIFKSMEFKYIPVVLIVDKNGKIIGSAQGEENCISLLDSYKLYH